MPGGGRVGSGPHRTFVEVAANGGSEPNLTDAALRMNVGYYHRVKTFNNRLGFELGFGCGKLAHCHTCQTGAFRRACPDKSSLVTGSHCRGNRWGCDGSSSKIGQVIIIIVDRHAILLDPAPLLIAERFPNRDEVDARAFCCKTGK